MGKAILCLGKYAEKSYHIKQMDLCIYSIEELCFYLREKAYLIEPELIDTKLLDWIKIECELPELANKLERMIKRKTSLAIFVKTILEDTFYCEPKEAGEIEALVHRNSFQNKFQKKKNLGDYFASKRKFAQAIYIYETVVKEMGDSDKELRSKIYHNLGVMQGQFFEFEKAAYYFMKAYQLIPTNESYLSYLLAKRMLLTEGQYVNFIGESKNHFQLSMEVERIVERTKKTFEENDYILELEEILAYRNTSYASEYYQKISELIYTWKREYRNTIG